MLVSIAVVPYVTVGVVVIDQEIGVVGEDVTRRQVDRRQLDVFRAGDFIYLAGVVGQVAAGFVAQIGRGFAVAGLFSFPGGKIDICQMRSLVWGYYGRKSYYKNQKEQTSYSD